jgi:hypothetical protein
MLVIGWLIVNSARKKGAREISRGKKPPDRRRLLLLHAIARPRDLPCLESAGVWFQHRRSAATAFFPF